MELRLRPPVPDYESGRSDAPRSDAPHPMHPTDEELARHARADRRAPFAQREGVHVVPSRSWRMRSSLGAWLPHLRTVITWSVLAAAAWAAWNFERREDATPAERATVVTPETLGRWTAGSLAAAFVPAETSVTTQRHLLGDVEVVSEAHGDGPDGAHLWSRASWHADDAAARQTFQRLQVDLVRTFRIHREEEGRFGLIRTDEHHLWGDEVRAFRVVEGTQTVGYAFAGRSGTRTFDVTLRGIDLGSDRAFAALVRERLVAFDALELRSNSGTGPGDGVPADTVPVSTVPMNTVPVNTVPMEALSMDSPSMDDTGDAAE